MLLLPPAGADWSAVAASLRLEGTVLTPNLDPPADHPVILEGSALAALAAISGAGLDSAALCGTGFGAMAAMTAGAGFPRRVRALVLSTARTPESTALLSLQHGLRGLLPASTAHRFGATPAQVTGLLDQVRPNDYRAWVAKVDVPALVLVGDSDVANLGPSSKLATALPQARLQIVPRAGAGWVVSEPDRYAELVWAYLRSLA